MKTWKNEWLAQMISLKTLGAPGEQFLERMPSIFQVESSGNEPKTPAAPRLHKKEAGRSVLGAAFSGSSKDSRTRSSCPGWSRPDSRRAEPQQEQQVPVPAAGRELAWVTPTFSPKDALSGRVLLQGLLSLLVHGS